MVVEFEVHIQLIAAPGVSLSFEPMLEVSLDCSLCQRLMRTVVVKENSVAARCTPTGHAFPASFVSIQVEDSTCSLIVSYEYTPFVDSRHSTASSPEPTWARVSFEVRCAACGVSSRRSTQTNLARPDDCFCKCGTLLCRDTQAPRFVVR
jgi:hypothetical protein